MNFSTRYFVGPVAAVLVASTFSFAVYSFAAGQATEFRAEQAAAAATHQRAQDAVKVKGIKDAWAAARDTTQPAEQRLAALALLEKEQPAEFKAQQLELLRAPLVRDVEAGKAAKAKAAEAVSKHLLRMHNMKPNDFCQKELRKLTKVKGVPEESWFIALASVASPHGVNGHHLTLVQDGRMEVGMPMCAAIASWGWPDTINRTQASYGRHEQWVYGNGNYVYFEDERLVTTVQTSR